MLRYHKLNSWEDVKKYREFAFKEQGETFVVAWKSEPSNSVAIRLQEYHPPTEVDWRLLFGVTREPDQLVAGMDLYKGEAVTVSDGKVYSQDLVRRFQDDGGAISVFRLSSNEWHIGASFGDFVSSARFFDLDESLGKDSLFKAVARAVKGFYDARLEADGAT